MLPSLLQLSNMPVSFPTSLFRRARVALGWQGASIWPVTPLPPLVPAAWALRGTCCQLELHPHRTLHRMTARRTDRRTTLLHPPAPGLSHAISKAPKQCSALQSSAHNCPPPLPPGWWAASRPREPGHSICINK